MSIDIRLNSIYFLSAILLLIADTVLTFFYFKVYDVELLLLVHFIISILYIGLFLIIFKSQFLSSKFFASSCCSCIVFICFPILGAFFALMVLIGHYLLQRYFIDNSSIDVDSYFPGQHELTKHQFQNEDPLYTIRKKISFEPFINILQGNNPHDKLKVLQKLRLEPSQQNIDFLKTAIQDSLSEVRLFAAQSLLALEDKVENSIAQACDRAEIYPSKETYGELGDIYVQYATMGFLGKNRQNYYLNKAAEAYRAALDEDTNDVEIMVRYAKILHLLGENKKAIQFLDKLFAIWPENKELIYLRAEVAFKLRLFASVTETLQKASSADDERQKWVLQYWLK